MVDRVLKSCVIRILSSQWGALLPEVQILEGLPLAILLYRPSGNKAGEFGHLTRSVEVDPRKPRYPCPDSLIPATEDLSRAISFHGPASAL